jgi:hypothetical protein
VVIHDLTVCLPHATSLRDESAGDVQLLPAHAGACLVVLGDD